MSVVVSFYADDKRRLLRDILVPAASRVRDMPRTTDQQPVSYLERHWLRGPHVRWVFNDVSDERAASARAAQIRAALADSPSDATLDPHAYLALSAKLARTELVEPPFAPLRPDNDVSWEMWESPLTVSLVGAGGLVLKERYLTAALDPLAVALDNGRAPLVNAFVTMVLNACASPFNGISGGQMSYRSHVEDFLANNDPAGLIKAGFEQRLAAARPALERCLEDTVGASADDDPLVSSWGAALRQVWATATDLSEQGQILADHGPGYLERASGIDAEVAQLWRFGPDRTVSAMHVRLAMLDRRRERARVPEFAAYKHVTNLMIRWLTLLGITPLERYFLCYAISRLVLERHGLTLEAVLSRYEERSEPPGAASRTAT
jgi:hypothetical protein